VKPDDPVKAGTPLFYDKDHPEIKFVSPVSGKVGEIIRGDRRKILMLVIISDGRNEHLTYTKSDPADLSGDEIKKILLESGLWPAIRQRPYSVIADPGQKPKSVFISGFDSAPLAPDYDFMVKDSEAEFRKGIIALNKLAPGKVHLSLRVSENPSRTFVNAGNVVLHRFSGPHPSGNVGVHIHHHDPINKGDIVWYLDPMDVIQIGKLFISGHPDHSAIIAITGSEIKNTGYVRTIRGACITPFIANNVSESELRYISGNVLTGSRIEKDGFIGYYDHQLTVIPEGKYYDFLGWLLPGLKKYSMSRAFFSWLHPEKEYRLDTNIKGGHRAFVLSGEYEKVFPMDIHPVYLLKAILAEDIDKMEKLGIYEVSEEDFALCEFVCTSKTDVQNIIRKGLDLIRKEME
jgi:Na+-transporting NADH:ubiquinone oxidoreductase subunit A